MFLLQKIEQRNRIGEAHFKIRPDSLPQMFEFAYLREKRKKSFNQHSVVPFAARADFQIFRLLSASAKTSVCQNNHFVPNAFNQRQKLGLGNICRFHRPIGNESELVCQNTQFAADNPSPRSETFLADALPMWLMIFTRSDDTTRCRKNQSRPEQLALPENVQSSFDAFSNGEKDGFCQANQETVAANFA